MILEVLLPTLSKDKTFFYTTNPSISSKIDIGQLVNLTFRKKPQVGVVIKKHKELNLTFRLLKINKVLEGLILKKEVLKSIEFLSVYTCSPISIILKNFLSSFCLKSEKLEKSFETIKRSKILYSYDQIDVQKKIQNLGLNKFNVITLNGVTGSGKTRVYMNIVKKKLEKGFQCLILVPEIILTKDWVKEIEKDFGIVSHIYHSSEKKKKRLQIWKSVILGERILVIGTRSALFLPFTNLGFVVVDEEHDQSYKQEDKLIFNSRDFAIVRAKNSNCPIILSSATPSVETIYNSRLGKYIEVNLKKRINNLPLPNIKIADMRGKTDIICDNLKKCIEDNLKKKLQTMIFINKRGYASLVICGYCGNVKFCPNCSSSMVIHNYSKMNDPYLLCHQCNYKENFINKCENCKKSDYLKFAGTGIEKINEEIKKLFPEAKTCMLSSDQFKKVGEYERVLEKISTNKADIIIGTQLVSKGHNFPKIKTVGILNVDFLLNDFDFRSNEKSYQQIMQVSGRAGRQDLQGEVIIQTLQPQHPTLNFCKKYRINEFYEWEINSRKKKNHPPFSNFISIVSSSSQKKESLKLIKLIDVNLRKKFKNLIVYGPAPSLIEKKNNQYRYKILIKLIKDFSFQNKIKFYLKNINLPNRARVFIDVDPLNFI